MSVLWCRRNRLERNRETCRACDFIVKCLASVVRCFLSGYVLIFSSRSACAIGWYVDTEGVFVCCGSAPAGPCVRVFLIPVCVERPASQLSPHPGPCGYNTLTVVLISRVCLPPLPKFLSLMYPCALPCRPVPEQLKLEPSGRDEVLDWSKTRAPGPTGNSFTGLLGWGNGF